MMWLGRWVPSNPDIEGSIRACRMYSRFGNDAQSRSTDEKLPGSYLIPLLRHGHPLGPVQEDQQLLVLLPHLSMTSDVKTS